MGCWQGRVRSTTLWDCTPERGCPQAQGIQCERDTGLNVVRWGWRHLVVECTQTHIDMHTGTQPLLLHTVHTWTHTYSPEHTQRHPSTQTRPFQGCRAIIPEAHNEVGGAPSTVPSEGQRQETDLFLLHPRTAIPLPRLLGSPRRGLRSRGWETAAGPQPGTPTPL